MIELLTEAFHAGNERSRQTHVGPSEFGSCRKRVWLRLNDAESCNQTLRLSAWIGTAVHDKLQRYINYIDPFHDRYEVECEVWSEDHQVLGHVDLYDKEDKRVIDWKTTTKAKLSSFPSDQQRWQVQLYGWLLQESGQEVNTVTLVAIPRDADERYIKVHSEPYDPEIAMQALSWMREIKELNEAPPAEMHPNFCKHYCNFYDEEGVAGCSGMTKS